MHACTHWQKRHAEGRQRETKTVLSAYGHRFIGPRPPASSPPEVRFLPYPHGGQPPSARSPSCLSPPPRPRTGRTLRHGRRTRSTRPQPHWATAPWLHRPSPSDRAQVGVRVVARGHIGRRRSPRPMAFRRGRVSRGVDVGAGLRITKRPGLNQFRVKDEPAPIPTDLIGGPVGQGLDDRLRQTSPRR